MIAALQVVANYPESSDFVRAVQQGAPGLAAYLQAAAQPSGCESAVTSIGASPIEAEARVGTGETATTGSSDEVGRKEVTQEITASTSTDSKTESPTSRPPPDKQRADAPKPTLKSVVITRPQFRVEHVGVVASQMSMKEANKRNGTHETISDTSPVPSGTATATTATNPNEPIEAEEPRPPAFLPPSEDVSVSLVANDCKRIWEAARFFHAHMCATKRRAPTNNADQLIVTQYSIAAHVTRALRAHNADLTV